MLKLLMILFIIKLYTRVNIKGNLLLETIQRLPVILCPCSFSTYCDPLQLHVQLSEFPKIASALILHTKC